MHLIDQRVIRASRPGIMVAICWLAAGIAMIAPSERVHAASRGGDSVAFTPDTGDVRALLDRQYPWRAPLDPNIARQPDRLGVETGTAGFNTYQGSDPADAGAGNRGAGADLTAARRDPNILAVSTGSHRMRSNRPKASHSRLRRMN